MNPTNGDITRTVWTIILALEERDERVFAELFNVERPAEEWRRIAGTAIHLLWDQVGFYQETVQDILHYAGPITESARLWISGSLEEEAAGGSGGIGLEEVFEIRKYRGQ